MTTAPPELDGEYPGGMARAMREAFDTIEVALVFHGEEGTSVGVTLTSISELDVDPRRALEEAVRTGFVEVYWNESHREMFLRRGPRHAEVLPRVYGGAEPPSLEWFDARVRARRAAEEAGRARLEAIREAGRPKADNTAGALPAWLS